MYSVRQYRNRIEIININTTDKRWNGGVMSIFTGAGVAIVTPMKANGEINYDKLAELLDYQINNSTDAIVICGTTGESATMTEKEHIEAIRLLLIMLKREFLLLQEQVLTVLRQLLNFQRKHRRQALTDVLL